MMSHFLFDSLSEPRKLGALALGNFDGVHRGHRELLLRAVKLSNQALKPSGAMTFSPHPRAFFSKFNNEGASFLKIYDLEQNIALLSDQNIQEVFTKVFDRTCSELSSVQFLDLIFSKLKFDHLVVGEDFRFGKERSGGALALQNWCLDKKVTLSQVPLLESNEKKISSTRIKKALLSGDVANASELLGGAYFLSGETHSDQGLGSQIGFPTLNFRVDSEVAIARGVYTSLFTFGDVQYRGISNIGFRPTVSDCNDYLVLETHLLEPEIPKVPVKSIVRVELRAFIRGEQKFSNLDELKAQIEVDIRAAKAKLY